MRHKLVADSHAFAHLHWRTGTDREVFLYRLPVIHSGGTVLENVVDGNVGQKGDQLRGCALVVATVTPAADKRIIRTVLLLPRQCSVQRQCRWTRVDGGGQELKHERVAAELRPVPVRGNSAGGDD